MESSKLKKERDRALKGVKVILMYFLHLAINTPTKHICFLVPAPYLHKFSAVVQIVNFFVATLHYI